MATYLSTSGVKGDTVQTLYLMNPTSYTGYGESPNSSSMVVLNATTGLAGQGSHLGHPQQHYAGFSIPQPVSHIGALSDQSMGHHSASPEMLTNRMNSHYGWNGGGGGNELLFIPASDLRDDNQSLPARINSMNPGQSPPVVSQIGMQSLGQASFQEHMPYIPSGVALTADTLQASAGAGHVLSLSLSPQQPTLNQLQSFPIQHPELGINSGPSYSEMAAESYSAKPDRFSNQWNGASLNAFRASPTILGSGLQDLMIGAANNNRLVLASSPRMELYASKYLKPTQQLLIEVVSVGRAFRSSSTNQTKIQSWTRSNSFGSTFSPDKTLAESIGKDGGTVFGQANQKDGAPTASTMPIDIRGSLEQTPDNATELTSAERQELRMKKAKLLAMLDEVHQRYRQYHHQMQIVVASFEEIAGLGAARTYTALALQTISKHFRCLKDAIKGQIQVTCKALAEEETLGHTKGETSRLRFIDQQLRQQRAFQQLGMMQQHPWRPQRGLPERSVSVLRAWLFEHFLHPYPKDSDKVLLARQTGLTRNQVSNWFINARVRLWKPMVEEMYVEETKDEEDTEDATKLSQGDGENSSKGVGLIDAVAGSNDTHKLESKSEDQETELIQNKLLTSVIAPDSFLFQDKDNVVQSGVKRLRMDAIDNTPFLSPNLNSNMDMKSYDLHVSNGLKLATENMQLSSYGIHHHQEGLVQNNSGGYGLFNSSRLSRYVDEGPVGTTYPPTASTGVSLTLGLQHSEGLSLGGSQQQPYAHAQGSLHVGRGQGGAVNYYSMHDIAAGGDSGSYETMSLQDRKRLASQLLQQDFS